MHQKSRQIERRWSSGCRQERQLLPLPCSSRKLQYSVHRQADRHADEENERQPDQERLFREGVFDKPYDQKADCQVGHQFDEIKFLGFYRHVNTCCGRSLF